MSRGKKEWKDSSLPHIFGSRDLAENTVIKIIINRIAQIRDKTVNVTQDQIEFGRWK